MTIRISNAQSKLLHELVNLREMRNQQWNTTAFALIRAGYAEWKDEDGVRILLPTLLGDNFCGVKTK